MNNEIVQLYDTFEDDYLTISKKYLQISEIEIDNTLMNHSAIYAYFAGLLSYAKQVRDELSIELDKQESITMKKRSAELATTGKKVAQTALNSYVLSVPEIVELKNKMYKLQFHKIFYIFLKCFFFHFCFKNNIDSFTTIIKRFIIKV